MVQWGSHPAPLWWWKVIVVVLCGPLALLALHCPSHCQCLDHTSMDCSHGQLSHVPNVQPQTSPLVRVNLSSNSLTSLDDLLQRLPVAQTTLDLSYNRISSIPRHTFSGEQFLDLTTLNLSSNLLSDVAFVFPSSLQVLRLSANEIHTFCIGSLKGLHQLRVLHLESNNLKTLACIEEEKNSVGHCPFQPLPLIIEVWLNENKLKTVELVTLDCLHNAHFLSLADNTISSLPPKLFNSFHNLRYLDLSGNQLTFLVEGMFLHMPSIKFISLARNRLTQVPAALPMLEWLDLSNNVIASVLETQKADLYPQEVFLLGGNPLHCVCDLLWLKELYNTRQYLLQFTDVDRKKFIPVCGSPGHIRGDSWDVLDDQAFGCRGSEVTQSNTASESHDRPTILQLEELAVKVQDVGTTYIRLDWDSFLLLGDKPIENREMRKVLITCHQFGHKQKKKTARVHLTLGSHRLHGLQPSTAYVVCVALADSLVGETHHGYTSRNDCMEVVTKDDAQASLQDIYMRISVVMLVSVLLAIKCCYTSSQRKDVAARFKAE